MNTAPSSALCVARCVAVSTALLPALLAQTPPCEAYNDQSPAIVGGVTSGSGLPSTSAWVLTASNTVLVRSIRLFTENTWFPMLPTQPPWAYMGVELWTDAGTAPGNRLGGGIWRLDAARALAWQGANLDTPVQLTAGTRYWLVWQEPGGSRPPIQPSAGTTAMPFYRLVGGTWTLFAFEFLKCRMYCSLLDEQGVVPFGAPCTGSGGRTGSLFTNELPTISNSLFGFEGYGFPAGAFGFIGFGSLPNFPSTTVPGLPASCLLHTDVLVTSSFTTATGIEAGHFWFPAPIPAAPAFVGVFFSAQVAVIDTGLQALLPATTSNALRLTVF